MTTGKMLKILIVLPSINAGGAEKISLYILKSLDRTMFDVSAYVISKSNELISHVPSDMEVFIPDRRRSKLYERLHLLRYILSGRPDIVFTSDLNVTIQLALFKVVSRRFKLYVRLSGNPRSEYDYGYFSILRQKLQGVALRLTDKVICQNNYLQVDSVDFFKLDVKKTVVWNNFVDTDLITSRLDGAKSPFSKKGKHIVCSGRLHFSKGFDIAIRSFALLLAESDISAELHILGSDRGEELRLRNLAMELGVSDNVHFEGFQENPYPYYLFCDLFVLSSRYEAYPNTLLENLYLNTPIVTTNCAAVIQDLVTKENGVILEDPTPRKMMIAIQYGLQLSRLNISNRYDSNVIDLNYLFH